MPVLSLDKAHFAFGAQVLLDGVDLSLDRGDKVALIGRNGAGKSTLLRVLAGQYPPDAGHVWRLGGNTVAYVEQEPPMVADQTIYATVAQGLGDLSELVTQYHDLTHELSTGEGNEAALLKKLERVQSELDRRDGWQLQTNVDETLMRLSLPGDRKISELSGGTKKRVALARAWVSKPDLLLLDEPTNHLDIESIAWLEDLLLEYTGALVFVTHDRRFLDRVASKVVELDRGTLRTYPGTYQQYLERKEQELAAEATENAKFDDFLAQEEVWIRKGVQARRTRNEGRVRRLESLRLERSARRDRLGDVNFKIDAGERSGKLVVEMTQVGKSFGDLPVIQSFNTRVMRGDRIGLIGPNGVGKSTLLKLMLGELTPDTGEVRLGTNLQVAYFDQMRAQLDENQTISSAVCEDGEWVQLGDERKHVMTYLRDFLFAPERARLTVSSLSGGERNRLLLARLFTQPANVLVLDEPTNDLDIETLEMLEELLANYSGTIFLVSHDRAFLDQVVTQSLVFTGSGKIVEIVGGYADWLAQRDSFLPTTQPSTSSAEKKSSGQKTVAARPKPAARGKLATWEQKELETLPAKMDALEKEQVASQAKLNDPGLYGPGGDGGDAIRQRIAAVEAELMALMERWEVLEAKRG